jgi:FkbM family methyltransferase
MNKFNSNKESHRKWLEDRGDDTHIIMYDLDENSTIMDLGGYNGAWIEQMINKYNPNAYIVEPIPKFYNEIVNKFKNNNRVRTLNVGVSTENKKGKIYLNGYSTSSNFNNGNSIDVTFKTISDIMSLWNLDNVDLLQINIEGDEYLLLENMLESGIINRFKNVQIQFHIGIDGDVERRNNIRDGLVNNGFRNKFNYPFVWESWEKIK